MTVKTMILTKQDATLSVRLYKIERDAIKAEAKRKRMSLSRYVLEACVPKAKRVR